MRYSACVVLLGMGVFAFAVRAADDKGTVVELDGLKSQAPAGWKETEPPEAFRRLRLKQFRLPKVGDDKRDGEVVINYFGKGGGGGLDANVQRWKGMMQPADGKKIDDVFKVEKFKVGDVSVTYVDVEGTYKGAPFEKIEPRPNYRMIRVYFDSANGPYFLSLVGPTATVMHYKKGFDDWLKAFK